MNPIFFPDIPERPSPTTIVDNNTQTLSTTPTFSTTTMTTWQSTQEPSSTVVPITRIPLLLKLGNQTVDVNRSFRVPQPHDSNSTYATMFPTVVTTDEAILKKTETISESSNASVSTSTSGPKLKPWQGTKHEHEGRYGPQFEDEQSSGNTTAVVQAGDTALFDCRVSLLRDKTVNKSDFLLKKS